MYYDFLQQLLVKECCLRILNDPSSALIEMTYGNVKGKFFSIDNECITRRSASELIQINSFEWTR